MKRVLVMAIILFINLLNFDLGAQTVLQVAKSGEGNQAKPGESTLLKGLEISGELKFYWYTDIKKSGDETNGIEFDDAYLTVSKKYDKIFSMKFETNIEKTSDTSGQDNTPGEITTTPDEKKYDIYMKYAFLQVDKTFTMINLNFKAGMVPTPVKGFLDDLGDQGWYHDHMLEMGSDAVPGGWTFDNCSDLGLNFNINIANILNIETAIVHGEGYKHVEEEYNGKAYYAKFDITPIKQVHIFGFTKYNFLTIADDTLANSGWRDNYEGYWGGGIAWRDDLIKIGAYYAHPFMKDHGEHALNTDGNRQNLQIIDTWINLDFKKATNVPFMIYTRYGMGRDVNLENGVSRINYYNFGLGYALNDNIKSIVYYEFFQPDEGDNIQKLYLKLQLLF